MSKIIKKCSSIVTAFFGGIGGIIFAIIFFASPPAGIIILGVFGLYVLKVNRKGGNK